MHDRALSLIERSPPDCRFAQATLPMKGRESLLVKLAAEGFDLFLEPELLSLELLEPEFVGRRPAHFVLDRLFEGLVTGPEFTDPGI